MSRAPTRLQETATEPATAAAAQSRTPPLTRKSQLPLPGVYCVASAAASNDSAAASAICGMPWLL